jgi:putative oxidoreductase
LYSSAANSPFLHESLPTPFITSGEMAAAYFTVHASKGLLPIVNGGELAVLYCFLFLYMAAHGSGVWSVDAWMSQKGTQLSTSAELGNQ